MVYAHLTVFVPCSNINKTFDRHNTCIFVMIKSQSPVKCLYFIVAVQCSCSGLSEHVQKLSRQFSCSMLSYRNLGNTILFSTFKVNLWQCGRALQIVRSVFFDNSFSPCLKSNALPTLITIFVIKSTPCGD